MILAIRKPIARFMRYAFGRQYVFVLTSSGKMKLRRVFRSEWDGSRYVRADHAFPPASRIAIDDLHQHEFKGWRTATFTEAERRAAAVVSAMDQEVNEFASSAKGSTVNIQPPLRFAEYKKLFDAMAAKPAKP